MSIMQVNRARVLVIGVFLVLGALALPLTAFAQGGPPMLTDDPGTVDYRHWEINTAVTVEKSETSTGFEAPLIDINYGLRDGVQLKLEFPYAIVLDKGETRKTGVGSFNAGVKLRFRNNEKGGFAISSYPQFEFKPAASVRRGVIDRGSEFLLPLEVARKLGPIDLNFEVGYRFKRFDRDQLLYGLAVGKQFTKRLELDAEIHGEPRRDFLEDDRVINFGGRFQLSKHFTLLFSAGRSLRPDNRDGAVNLVMYTGLQSSF
jgi:hypothetical protein